jgi:CBS domain-containing protein
MRTYRVTDCMSTPPILVQPTTTLVDAQRVMEQRKVRRLPVVEDGQLVAIVTWGDLVAARLSVATTLSAYERRALLDCTTIAGCMTRDPVTILPDASLLDAAQRMLNHKIRGLPVIDRGRVIGMITESDLFEPLVAGASRIEDRIDDQDAIVCGHCGAMLRGRYLANLGPNDVCWYCHFHLHQCENCQHFGRPGCLLDQVEHRAPIPGQHCPAFSYLPLRAASVGIKHRAI